jgi:hypothetical protein
VNRFTGPSTQQSVALDVASDVFVISQLNFSDNTHTGQKVPIRTRRISNRRHWRTPWYAQPSKGLGDAPSLITHITLEVGCTNKAGATLDENSDKTKDGKPEREEAATCSPVRLCGNQKKRDIEKFNPNAVRIETNFAKRRWCIEIRSTP